MIRITNEGKEAYFSQLCNENQGISYMDSREQELVETMYVRFGGRNASGSVMEPTILNVLLKKTKLKK